MVPSLKIETPMEPVTQAKQAMGPSQYLLCVQLPILEVSPNSN